VVPKSGNEKEDADAVVVHEAGRLHADKRRLAPTAVHGASLSCFVERACSGWPIASMPDLKAGGVAEVVEAAGAG
jgi:hypothetical protein